jgi:single-strand DNA-binding protein
MASDLNRVMLIGRLGADPETRRTQGGQLIVNFRIATGDSWRDKNTGERREKADWHNIVVWNENIAKLAEQYLRKGSRIYIEGKLQTRKWQDQNGTDRWTTEVVLSGFDGKIQFLDTKDRDDGSGGSSRRGDDRGSAPRSSRDDFNDDIPF